MATTKDVTVSQAVPIRYEINNPASHLQLAKELTKFVVDNRLTTNIKGKEYVNVEAWQFIGTSMGIFPVVESVEHIQRDAEICYQATVSLLNVHSGQIVGRGVAFCSNKEQGKKYFDEYAIASMAQTRSVGKAYRLAFGWLMKAAGYEPTPSEEMDVVILNESKPEVKKESKKEQQKPTQAEIDRANMGILACEEVRKANDLLTLKAIWDLNPAWHSEKEFKDAVKKRKAELTV